MNWLHNPPLNYWLLGYLMVGLLAIWFILALFRTGYAQTDMPVWYRWAMNAYIFPMNWLGMWLETCRAPRWIWPLVNGLTLMNLLVNLTLVALPLERLLMRGWRAVQTLF